MECEKIGLDYAAGLSYLLIDKSDLSFGIKRNLLFSVYSFRCLFDNKEMLQINPILKKYGCSFETDYTLHPDYNENKDGFDKVISTGGGALTFGGIIIKSDDGYKLKFDAGSELFNYFIKIGKIAKQAPPAKFSLYETALKIISLNCATDELKAIWYIIFPYIITIGTPYEPEKYYKIKELLINGAVFEKVLESKYSLNIADSLPELRALDIPNLVIDFLLPFIEYKTEKNEKGVLRCVEHLQKWLKDGKFYDVFLGSEKLLDTYPDDEDLLLVNIASRISLDKEITKDNKEKLLLDTVSLLDELLSSPKQKKAYFLYYWGLGCLGLKRLDDALDKFNECLEHTPSFEPAKMMIKLINK